MSQLIEPVARLIESLSRLPGVADVKVSVARERLNLSLAENKTPVEKIEDTLRKLGFKPALLPQEKAPQAKAAKSAIKFFLCSMRLNR